MKKIKPILVEQQTEFTGLISNIANKVNQLVESVNTINEVLSDEICGCGTPFKNHGTGRSGYCTDPSKPSEEGVQGPNAVPSGYGHVDPRDAEAIRADDRAILREKFDKVLNEASVCEEIKVMYSVFKDFIQELK